MHGCESIELVLAGSMCWLEKYAPFSWYYNKKCEDNQNRFLRWSSVPVSGCRTETMP